MRNRSANPWVGCVSDPALP